MTKGEILRIARAIAKRLSFLALALMLLHTEAGNAQSLLEGGTIEEIRIEGSLRIDPRTIRSYMTVDPGDPFDAIALNETLKRLFETGFFADVALRREADSLVVVVEEHPTINRIAFEGNDRIDDETLQSEVELQPSRVFTRSKAQSDSDRIRDLYRRQGRFAATVEPNIIRLEQNRVDLVFEIDEGPKTTISAINFIGNKAFSDGSLRSEVLSDEYSFWNFLTTTDTYDPDRLQFDEQLLSDFYKDEGYADFKVLSTSAELTPERDSFIITFVLQEGERYRYGSIDVATTLRNLDVEAVQEAILTEEGEWYSAKEVSDTVSNLSDQVGTLGFAFVDITPRVERDLENKLINLVYEINEGPKVFVERIDISGNTRTLDRVIRREFQVVEGDAFNATKIRRSRDRIRNLGFFETVEVDSQPGTTPDRTVIDVEVTEQSTGEFSFGAGFSTSLGPIGQVGVRERNLLGKGQDLQINLLIAGSRSQIDLSFTEPYFLDRNLAAGFDLFRVTTQQDESSFDEERTGGGVRAGYNLSNDLRQLWDYTLTVRKITDVDSTASTAIKAEEGETVKSSLEHSLRYSTISNRLSPTDGVNVTFATELAGLGGTEYFVKNRVDANYYIPAAEDVVIRLGAQAGNITSLHDDTSVSDRFFVGGATFRGFAIGGVGPRDTNTDDSLGAENFAVGTIEATFPLGLPESIGIKGRLFTDFGTAFDTPSITGANIADESGLRASVGFGFSWSSPLGPLAIDFGFPVVKEDFDDTSILYFSLGTQF